MWGVWIMWSVMWWFWWCEQLIKSTVLWTLMRSGWIIIRVYCSNGKKQVFINYKWLWNGFSFHLTSTSLPFLPCQTFPVQSTLNVELQPLHIHPNCDGSEHLLLFPQVHRGRDPYGSWVSKGKTCSFLRSVWKLATGNPLFDSQSVWSFLWRILISLPWMWWSIRTEQELNMKLIKHDRGGPSVPSLFILNDRMMKDIRYFS